MVMIPLYDDHRRICYDDNRTRKELSDSTGPPLCPSESSSDAEARQHSRKHTDDDSSLRLERQPHRSRRRSHVSPRRRAPMNPVRNTRALLGRDSNALLILICLAQFMVILDVSIVNVALPTIRDGLGFSTAGLQWVVNAYTLTFAGFLLLGGRASDLLGRRRVFLAGT